MRKEQTGRASDSTLVDSILAERLRRQGLVAPAKSPADYLALFRLLQPVSTVYFSRPGSPPHLMSRATIDQEREANRLRAGRAVVKGRFLGGTIGYVLAEDLGVYANAFARPLAHPDERQEEILRKLQTTGPLTPRQIKEETGLLNKEIMPALHRLQSAFAVYEDQTDEDWERPWFAFASEWPDVEVAEGRRLSAFAAVLERFLRAHVFASEQQIRDWSQAPRKLIGSVLAEMRETGRAVQSSVAPWGEGWMLPEHRELAPARPKRSVFMLDRGDCLVRSHDTELAGRFAGLEVLQYLLIDGRFAGAVVGHWRIGPHDVEDIVLTLPKAQRQGRRREVIAAVAARYRPPYSHILRFDGKGEGK